MPATLALLAPSVLIALIATIVATQAWRAHRRVLQARRWRQTSGIVILSEVREQQVRHPTGIGERYRMATRYAPHVVYHYVVDGVTYQADRLTLATTLLDSERAAAERAAERYPFGATVTIHYNPANPADATLKPHSGGGALLLWLVALGLLAIAGYLATLAIA